MSTLRPAPFLAAASVLVAAGALSACSGSSAPRNYYVSLGDSYSVGYQPSPTPGATRGYTAMVAAGTHSTLANFGCGAPTSSSILTTPGCNSPFGPMASSGAVSYPDHSQASAAEAFIRAHRGHVTLITVSIGGNDIVPCASQANPVTCVTTALPVLESNVTTLAQGLRSAAGPKVPIMGLTYPDVLLGLWVYPTGSPNQTLASLSVTAFKSFVNPALSAAYAKAAGTFVDVTAATGAYTPLAQTTTLAPYGTIPSAVAQVCKLTWFCTRGNIHATTAGYDLIGQQILAAFHRAAKT